MWIILFMILDGKVLSDKLYKELNVSKRSKLIILTVGEDPASKVYVKNKIKACEKVGIQHEHITLDDMTEYEFATYVTDLIESNVKSVFNFGIILQLPAPEKYVKVFNMVVPPSYDVDGFGYWNRLKLYLEEETPSHYPATPRGILTLLDNYEIPIIGKHVVIIGRSEIVGKPLAKMMMNRNATVTVCHSKTENLEKITKTADILVVAIGKPKFINSSHIKDGVTIIDVGINRTESGLCGDVDFDDIKDKCYAITPVPGGVGPMTVYSLIENVVIQ